MEQIICCWNKYCCVLCNCIIISNGSCLNSIDALLHFSFLLEIISSYQGGENMERQFCWRLDKGIPVRLSAKV